MLRKIPAAVQWSLAIIGVVLAALALTPAEWNQKLALWSVELHRFKFSGLDAVLGVVAALSLLLFLRAKLEIVIWPTRKAWWDAKLPHIIATCDKLVVLDSYQGSKHEFWTALDRRMEAEGPFHFVMLDLAKDDPLLAYCADTSAVPADVIDIDVQSFGRLWKKRNESSKGGNKTVEFGYWTGESQGPLVAWTTRGNETIAAGLWQQVDGNTDLSPWLVVKRGPLFASFKSHYECLLHKTQGGGRLHSSMSTLTGAKLTHAGPAGRTRRATGSP